MVDIHPIERHYMGIWQHLKDVFWAIPPAISVLAVVILINLLVAGILVVLFGIPIHYAISPLHISE